MGLSSAAAAVLAGSCLAGCTIGTYVGSSVSEDGHVRGLIVAMGLTGGAIVGIVLINFVFM